MKTYVPPEWTEQLKLIPACRVPLAQLPTPVERWTPATAPGGADLWIKRDDQTGITLSGNKARKLEFLLAEALENHCDTIITAGGLQSNHARATAVAARQLGLPSHLVLFSPTPDEDPGLVGNLLLDRLVGAELHLIPPKDIPRNEDIMHDLADALRKEGRRPYVIPVGGSNALGTWGYIEAVREIARDQDDPFDDIVFACGSGGTAAGVALGVRLKGLNTRVHAVNVCQTASYFYEHINETFRSLGHAERAEDLIDIIDGYVGRGYAQSRPEELTLLRDTALSSGVILDPVYTGKAYYGFCEEFRENRDRFKGNRILFIHTGGLFGLYDKLDELKPLLAE